MSTRTPLAQNYFGLFLSFASLFAFSIADNVRGAIYPDLLNHFGVSSGIGSLFFLVASGVAVVQQFFVPKLLEKLGSYFMALYIGYLMAMALGPGLQVYASSLPPSSTSFALLILGSMIFGLGMGGITILHGILLQASVSPAQVSKAFSLLHSLYGAGAFLSPFFVTGLRSAGFSWSSSLGLVFLLSVGLAVAAYFLKGQLPRYEPKQSQRVTEEITHEHRRWVLWCIIALTFCVSTEILISSRMTLYLREHLNFTPQNAEFYLSGFFLSLFSGRFFAAYRLTKTPFVLLGRWLGAAACAALLAALVLDPLFFLAVGFLIGPLFPMSLSELSRRDANSFSKDSSLLYGWVGLGIFTMHGLFGIISSTSGLVFAMSLGLVLLLFSAVSFGFLSAR